MTRTCVAAVVAACLVGGAALGEETPPPLVEVREVEGATAST